MADKMVRVSRYRDGDYVVNYDMNGRIITYKWTGCKGNKIDTKLIPDYVVDWLVMSTTAISNGSLVIEKDEASKEIIENINYEETVKNVVHTRKEIEEILTGNYNKMKSELSKIYNKAEKDFVISIAKELNIDSIGKRRFLAEWIGIDVDMLFIDEEIE